MHHAKLLVALLPSIALAQPTIVALQNNYSFTLPSSPNYGIAQGSLFVVIGTNFSGTSTGLVNTYPLPTTLNGVSLAVTINTTTTHPLLYYVTPTQIAAILPSATPLGTGTITLSSPGQNVSAPIQVVQSAFGILTLNGGGTGPAAAFDASFTPLSPTHSASPGSIITLWGSGAGPVTGDESNAQTPVNLTNVPIEVDIGGVFAPVAYHGRSIYPGVDQINVTVPPNVQPGCWVSVVVTSGNMVGNFATIPVAAGGGACSDTVTGYSGAQLQTLYSKSSFNTGSIAIGTITTPAHKINSQPVPAATSNNAAVQFSHFTSSGGFAQAMLAPEVPTVSVPTGATAVAAAAVSMGSCVVNPLGYINSPPALPFTNLDAGAAINITADTGTQSISPVNNFYGSNTTGNSLVSAFIPSAGDTFTFTNSPGGVGVGAFTTKVAVPPAFSWDQRDTLTSVNRSQGVAVTWQNAAPNSFVQITGMSSAGSGPIVLVTSFTCTVPASAGAFSVPASVLMSMPATGTSVAMVNPAFLAVGNFTYPQSFSAPGVDFATSYGYVIQSSSATLGFVYQ
jgi:uncharacterized protein (TIGR03437 family)